MIGTIIKYIFNYLLFTLVQVVVLNNIAIGGIASPMLYVYFLLLLPTTLSRNLVITIGFFLGLSIDVFCNTYGIHALATVVVAYLREPVAGLFNKRNMQLENYSSATMGRSIFMLFAAMMVFIHHLLFFVIEYFSFYNMLLLFYNVIASSALTLLLVLLIENFRSSAHE